MKLYKSFFIGTLLLIIFCATACSSGLPRGVLSKEKMQAVIWDIALAGEFTNGYVFPKDYNLNRAAVNDKMMTEILRLHNITKEDFNKSLDYYKTKPKVLIEIIDSISAKQSLARPENSGSPMGPPPGINPSIPAIDPATGSNIKPVQ